MIAMLTSTAPALRKTLESMATPCSVKAKGGHQRPPCELLRSQFVTSKLRLITGKLKSEVLGKPLAIPPKLLVETLVVTP